MQGKSGRADKNEATLPIKNSLDQVRLIETRKLLHVVTVLQLVKF